MNIFDLKENGQFIMEISSDFKLFFFLNKETKEFENQINTGQGLIKYLCYASFIDILTPISPFSKLLARCYNALFACCYCVLLLCWKAF